MLGKKVTVGNAATADTTRPRRQPLSTTIEHCARHTALTDIISDERGQTRQCSPSLAAYWKGLSSSVITCSTNVSTFTLWC